VDKSIHSAIDYDVKESTIYYTDSTNFRIMKKELNKTESEVLLEKGISHSEGIAIDWTGILETSQPSFKSIFDD
jgi:hypothetical protein